MVSSNPLDSIGRIRVSGEPLYGMLLGEVGYLKTECPPNPAPKATLEAHIGCSERQDMPGSTQYDNIKTAWNGVESQTPVLQVEAPTINHVLDSIGGIRGTRCLDLACGTGRWTRHLKSQGAVEAVGVDISPGMIDGARQTTGDMRDVHFHVADCSKPLPSPDNNTFNTPFEVVFGGYFLNYAANAEEMEGMWRTVAASLNVDGHFVGIMPNPDTDFTIPFPDDYGFQAKKVADVNQGQWDEGTKNKLMVSSQPPVEFEAYFLPKQVLEATAKRAGMGDIEWFQPIVPADDAFWEHYKKRPHFQAIKAVKLQETRN